MRKRIAIFSGGWGGEYVQEVLSGVMNVAVPSDVDVFLFLNFAVHEPVPHANISEINFFKLPKLEDFDGVILLANSFNAPEELDYFSSEIKRTGIPAITVEYEMEGIPSISSDNYAGMYDLVNHMIEEHNAKEMVYIGGPREHVENQERLKAFMDACSNHKIVVPTDNIFYADWAKNLIPPIIDKWVERFGRYPDAFICANDIMAISACNHLRNLGVDVPDDVMVTGYDCIRMGQVRVPSVTSVNHEWGTMGKIALIQLISMIGGGDIPHKSVLKTRFVSGGTCGCVSRTHRAKSSTELGRDGAKNQLDSIEMDTHFRKFYNSVKRVNNKTELYNNFCSLFELENDMEGSDFKICLDPEFFNPSSSEEKLLMEGHPEVYDVVCEIHNSKREMQSKCCREEALYSFSNVNDTPKAYVCLPLNSEGYTYGFAILTGGFNVANENQSYIWTRHMNMALEQLRSRLLLEKLYAKIRMQSITDELTGVYNRVGSTEHTYPMMLEHSKDGNECVAMLLDVDHMKVINDQFGHTSGDLALKIVVDTLKKELPVGFQIARFGGDEFFIGGKLNRQNRNIDHLIDKVDAALAEELIKREVKFPLTVSIGYAKCMPKSVIDIEKALALADEDMYKRKKLHHKISRQN